MVLVPSQKEEITNLHTMELIMLCFMKNASICVELTIPRFHETCKLIESTKDWPSLWLTFLSLFMFDSITRSALLSFQKEKGAHSVAGEETYYIPRIFPNRTRVQKTNGKQLMIFKITTLLKNWNIQQTVASSSHLNPLEGKTGWCGSLAGILSDGTFSTGAFWRGGDSVLRLSWRARASCSSSSKL